MKTKISNKNIFGYPTDTPDDANGLSEQQKAFIKDLLENELKTVYWGKTDRAIMKEIIKKLNIK